MLGYNLSCSDLGSHIEGYFLVKPGGHHHSGSFVFYVALSTRDYVAHTVYHSDIELSTRGKLHTCGLLRNELRLSSHDSPSARGLRQLVNSSFTAEITADVRYNKLLHKFLYKGRFTCSDWSYNTDVDVAARSCGYVFIYIVAHCPASVSLV